MIHGLSNFLVNAAAKYGYIIIIWLKKYCAIGSLRRTHLNKHHTNLGASFNFPARS